MKINIIKVLLICGFAYGCNSGNDPGEPECSYKPEEKQTKTYPFASVEKIEIISFQDSSWTSQTSDSTFGARIQKESILLNAAQKDSLFAILFNFKTKRLGGYRMEGASCYIPRHKIKFYKQEKVFASIEICLQCQRVRMDNFPEIDFCNDKWCLLQHYFEWVGIKYGITKDYCN